jgi:sugar-specific transcriptional regulator TrmB
MVEEEFTLDESDFDEAILEIAGEIDRINKLKPSEPLQNEPLVALKTEIEIKKVESISNNLFQMLKTIQEIQIFSNENKISRPNFSKIPKTKHIAFTKGMDQQYHAITITEGATESIQDQQNHEISLDDLFEDTEPVQNIKESLVNDSILINGPIKTINLPEKTRSNIMQQSKINERMIFQNFMKMHKK